MRELARLENSKAWIGLMFFQLIQMHLMLSDRCNYHYNVQPNFYWGKKYKDDASVMKNIIVATWDGSDIYTRADSYCEDRVAGEFNIMIPFWII